MEYMEYMDTPSGNCYSFLLKPWPIEIVDLPTKDCDVLVRYVAGALKKMFLGAPGVYSQVIVHGVGAHSEMPL